MPEPTVTPPHCACDGGHYPGEDVMCIGAYVYGPCDHPDCGGVCEITGDCRATDCACKKDDR